MEMFGHNEERAHTHRHIVFPSMLVYAADYWCVSRGFNSICYGQSWCITDTDWENNGDALLDLLHLHVFYKKLVYKKLVLRWPKILRNSSTMSEKY